MIKPLKACVIWTIGLSGSGKTSLNTAIADALRKVQHNVVVLDGDIVRECLGNTIDYSIENRTAQYRRIRNIAHELATQNHVVIVSTVYSTKGLRLESRKKIDRYFEVYLKCDLEILQQEDVKGLYKKYKNGEICNVVGLDIECPPPSNSDLILGRNDGSPQALTKRIFSTIPSSFNVQA